MLSFFFLALGISLGWWMKGTRAGSWISNAFSKDTKQ